MYIENIFHDKIDLRSFYFHVTKSRVLSGLYTPPFWTECGCSLYKSQYSVRTHENMDLRELHTCCWFINILFKERL